MKGEPKSSYTHSFSWNSYFSAITRNNLTLHTVLEGIRERWLLRLGHILKKTQEHTATITTSKAEDTLNQEEGKKGFNKVVQRHDGHGLHTEVSTWSSGPNIIHLFSPKLIIQGYRRPEIYFLMPVYSLLQSTHEFLFCLKCLRDFKYEITCLIWTFES